MTKGVVLRGVETVSPSTYSTRRVDTCVRGDGGTTPAPLGNFVSVTVFPLNPGRSEVLRRGTGSVSSGPVS